MTNVATAFTTFVFEGQELDGEVLFKSSLNGTTVMLVESYGITYEVVITNGQQSVVKQG